MRRREPGAALHARTEASSFLPTRFGTRLDLFTKLVDFFLRQVLDANKGRFALCSRVLIRQALCGLPRCRGSACSESEKPSGT
jgi:hypothetical protein